MFFDARFLFYPSSVSAPIHSRILCWSVSIFILVGIVPFNPSLRTAILRGFLFVRLSRSVLLNTSLRLATVRDLFCPSVEFRHYSIVRALLESRRPGACASLLHVVSTQVEIKIKCAGAASGSSYCAFTGAAFGNSCSRRSRGRICGSVHYPCPSVAQSARGCEHTPTFRAPSSSFLSFFSFGAAADLPSRYSRN